MAASHDEIGQTNAAFTLEYSHLRSDLGFDVHREGTRSADR
jgi:hypothetical protein